MFVSRTQCVCIAVSLARAVDVRVRACVCRARTCVQVCGMLLTCACVLARARECLTGVRVSACHADVLAQFVLRQRARGDVLV